MLSAGWSYGNPLELNKKLSKGTFIFPGGLDGKASTYNAEDLGSIPGSGISPGEGNGNPLQYTCLENTVDKGAWRATVHEVTKSWTQYSTHAHGN